jgi:hypothetical protein
MHFRSHKLQKNVKSNKFRSQKEKSFDFLNYISSKEKDIEIKIKNVIEKIKKESNGMNNYSFFSNFLINIKICGIKSFFTIIDLGVNEKNNLARLIDPNWKNSSLNYEKHFIPKFYDQNSIKSKFCILTTIDTAENPKNISLMLNHINEVKQESQKKTKNFQTQLNFNNEISDFDFLKKKTFRQKEKNENKKNDASKNETSYFKFFLIFIILILICVIICWAYLKLKLHYQKTALEVLLW